MSMIKCFTIIIIIIVPSITITCSSQFLAMPYYVIQRFFFCIESCLSLRIIRALLLYNITIREYTISIYMMCVLYYMCLSVNIFRFFFSSSLYFLFIQLCLKKREIFLFFFFFFCIIKFVNQHMAMNSLQNIFEMK